MSFGIIVKGKHSSGKKLTSRDLDKSFHLEDHSYKHYSRAFGCNVKSKEHYLKLMNDNGMVPFEQGERMAAECMKNKVKPYDDISDNTKKVIGELAMGADKQGKLASLDGTKRACESVGMKFDNLKYLPAHYSDKGGFYER